MRLGRLTPKEVELYLQLRMAGKSEAAAKRAIQKIRGPSPEPTEGQKAVRQKAAEALRISQNQNITLKEAWKRIKKQGNS
jgi:hypothetical protein